MRRTALALAAAVALLAGCGGDDRAATNATTTPTTVAASPAGGGDAVYRAFAEDLASYRYLDADAIATEYSTASADLADDERARIADRVVELAEREERRGRLPAGGAQQVRDAFSLETFGEQMTTPEQLP